MASSVSGSGPAGDGDRIRAGVRGGLIAGQFGITAGDDSGAVHGGEHVVFAHVDVDRMIDMMGQGVFAGVAAPVVGAAVVVLGFHLAPAQAAVQPTRST